MVTVTIDIVGMFYSREIDVPAGSSVYDAMMAAHIADYAARAQGGDNPVLDFSRSAKGFIKNISVDHVIRPSSRQMPSRKYPEGIYAYDDDNIELVNPSDPNSPLQVVNMQGKPLPDKLALAWQLYLYDAKGVDTSRFGDGSGTLRTVKSFSNTTVLDKSEIVWRLVGIFVKPSRGLGMKTEIPKLTQAKEAASAA